MTEIVSYVLLYEKSPFVLNVSEFRFDTWHVRQNTSSPTAAAGLVHRRSGTRSAGRQMLEVVRMNTSFGDRFGTSLSNY